MCDIVHNLNDIRSRIDMAARAAGRDTTSVRLLAVSKGKPVELIRAAYNAGQRFFGENYAQELACKAAELVDLDIRWHFIGHLQRNKAKLVAPVVNMMESLDSLELAQALDRRAIHPLDILVEVNIGDETSKSGVRERELPTLMKELGRFEKLNARGLMIIPPYHEDAEQSRFYFRRLREIRDELNRQGTTTSPLTELSMGMSHDFEIAIHEGATIVRIGTAIFGERT